MGEIPISELLQVLEHLRLQVVEGLVLPIASVVLTLRERAQYLCYVVWLQLFYLVINLSFDTPEDVVVLSGLEQVHSLGHARDVFSV